MNSEQETSKQIAGVLDDLLNAHAEYRRLHDLDGARQDRRAAVSSGSPAGAAMTPEQKPNYRWERIERLLEELRYECQRGMMEGEIDEQIGFRFIVPVSKAIPNGTVLCEFRTRPVPAYHLGFDPEPPKLRIVK